MKILNKSSDEFCEQKVWSKHWTVFVKGSQIFVNKRYVRGYLNFRAIHFCPDKSLFFQTKNYGYQVVPSARYLMAWTTINFSFSLIRGEIFIALY